MKFGRENIMIIIFAVVAVVLQILLSPYIKVFSATPNIIAAYVLAVSVVRQSSNRVVILAFVLGLCYNLFVGGTVGAMSALLVVLSFALGKCQQVLDNDTSFIPIVLMIIATLLLEVLYACVLSLTGSLDNLGATLVQISLPCAIYSIIFALIWYFVMKKFAPEPGNMFPSINDSTLLR